MSRSSACIVLFVKPPVPGRVKTRLARDIGNEAACAVYRTLADRVVAAATASGIPLCLCHDGDDASGLPGTWREAAAICLPQQGDDLGERMARAFTTFFAKGFETVVLIGSDIPGLDSRYLQAAFGQLQRHDLVIGPALDGGYCLIGCHRHCFCPVLFEAMPWSTGRVLALTLAVAEAHGLSVALQTPLQDIDTFDDLQTCINSGMFPHLHRWPDPLFLTAVKESQAPYR